MGKSALKLCEPRIVHTMLRVSDLDRSIRFYSDQLHMQLQRREDYPDGRFTLAFLGYGAEADSPAIELTHNWDDNLYEQGTAFGHIALEVDNLGALCASLESADVPFLRKPSPMSYESPQRQTREVFAFIRDPDGYLIELIERSNRPASVSSDGAPPTCP